MARCVRLPRIECPARREILIVRANAHPGLAKYRHPAQLIDVRIPPDNRAGLRDHSPMDMDDNARYRAKRRPGPIRPSPMSSCTSVPKSAEEAASLERLGAPLWIF